MPEVKYTGDGYTYVGWLEDAVGTAIDSVTSPSLADLAGIVDLSDHVVSGGVDMGEGEGTVDTASISSNVVSQAVGRTTVSPKITMWRYKQPDDTAWELVEKNTTGWLIIRKGKDSATPLAVGDMVTIAFVEMGEPQQQFGSGDNADQFVTNFVLTNGSLYNSKAVLVA